ncbi:hypothetical protein NKJ26_06155 [Mesorhizobium sp. M0152]|uniref:hypothetical protein n=1 Tax=Mesorhizobium sp. M0152 TaxID=2956898 RepID=UPI00333868AD
MRVLIGAFAIGTDAIGALGRTTELVISFDGFCTSSASMPDVDEQPARHSDAIKKLMTPGIRIWTCTRNTTDRGRQPTDKPDPVMNVKLPIKIESSFYHVEARLAGLVNKRLAGLDSATPVAKGAGNSPARCDLRDRRHARA